VSGTGPNDVYIVGSDDPCFFCNDYGFLLHWDGSSLGTALDLNDQLFSVWANTATDVWTVGEGPRYRWDGTQWRGAGSGYTSGIAGSSASNVWTYGIGARLHRWDGSGWVSKTATNRAVTLNSISGVGQSVWATSNDGRVLRWNGGGFWTDAAPNLTYSGVWAAATDKVWFVTSGTSLTTRILFWNGSSYVAQMEGSDNPLHDIHGSSETNIWAVGSGGKAYVYDGTAWTLNAPSTSANLLDVWTSGPSNVVAVGSSGAIHRFNGTTWAQQNSGTTRTLRSVWGSGPNDVWAVGDSGTILRWQGVLWATIPSGTTETFNAVWGLSANEVYAATDGGRLFRWNGSTWAEENSGTSHEFFGLWGNSTSGVWVVGTEAVLHKP
jgi:hypothetical protein